MKKFGSRSDVWNAECTMTRGGLTKGDLMMSKTGRIVSKKKSEAAKKAYDTFGFKKREQQETPITSYLKKQKKRKRKKKE